MSGRAIHWRCFHCGEGFTKAQERWAREHFGRDQGADPVCLIRTAGEPALLSAVRAAEDELTGYRAEDQRILRAMWAMQGDHRQALIREEQAGYDKGLRDGRKLSAAEAMTKAFEPADENDWRALFEMFPDDGAGAFWRALLTCARETMKEAEAVQ